MQLIIHSAGMYSAVYSAYTFPSKLQKASLLFEFFFLNFVIN